MMRGLRRVALGLIIAVVGSFSLVLPAAATPVSSCTADFSECDIYEDGQFFQPGFLFIAGDVVLRDPGTGTISDVLRFFNDLFDSGGGTGIGFTMFLYSDDEFNLPAASTFSVNAVFLTEGPRAPNGFSETDYNGNGTLYRIFSTFSTIPEPATWQLLAIALLSVAGMSGRARIKG